MGRRSSSASQHELTMTLAADELKQPLHTKVRQILRDQIQNVFEHNQRFYSEREVMRMLKVSQPTVRRAMSSLVSEGYLKPSQRRGFFVVKRVSQRFVGLFIPGNRYSLTDASFEALAESCRNNDFVMNVYYVHKEESAESAFGSIRHRAFEERIIMTGLTTELTLQIGAKLQAGGYGHLVLGAGVSGFSGSSLTFDHGDGVDKVLDYLTGLGHERIVFIVNEPRVLFVTSQRAAAVERKLRERNLTHSSLIYCDTKPWENSYTAAYKKTEEVWKTSSPKPTAIVPLSGVGAWATYGYAMTHGIRIPDELSIVAFDPVANSEILPIPLSELTFPYMERANKALEMLWSEAPMARHEVIRGGELVARASSGPARA
jgi:LacI family transcriptional regulator